MLTTDQCYIVIQSEITANSEYCSYGKFVCVLVIQGLANNSCTGIYGMRLIPITSSSISYSNQFSY